MNLHVISWILVHVVFLLMALGIFLCLPCGENFRQGLYTGDAIHSAIKQGGGVVKTPSTTSVVFVYGASTECSANNLEKPKQLDRAGEALFDAANDLHTLDLRARIIISEPSPDLHGEERVVRVRFEPENRAVRQTYNYDF